MEGAEMMECFRLAGVVVALSVTGTTESDGGAGIGYGYSWLDYQPYWYNARADSFPYRSYLNFRYRNGSVSAHFAHPRDMPRGSGDVGSYRLNYVIGDGRAGRRLAPATSRSSYRVSYARNYRRSYNSQR